MRSVANQKDVSLLEVFGHLLGGLPVRDVHYLYLQVWFAYAIQYQLTTSLDGVLLSGFFLDQKHAAISIGDQEEALDSWPLDEDRVIFVASNQFAPVSAKVDKEIAESHIFADGFVPALIAAQLVDAIIW